VRRNLGGLFSLTLVSLALVAAFSRVGRADSFAADSAAADSLGKPAGAPADTSLKRFLQQYSDSTEHYFGLSATPVDTAGLDSALAYGLVSGKAGRGHSLALSYGPWFAFNRVDGARYGGTASVFSPYSLGETKVRLGYLSGPNYWVGGLAYQKIWGTRRSETNWQLDLSGGRFTNSIDHDRNEQVLAWTRALIAGSDRQHYLRRDGVLAVIQHESPWLRASAGLRDELESPLEVTTGWDLASNPLAIPFNLAATQGRAREFNSTVTVRLPLLQGFAQGEIRTSGPQLNSDFTYRRMRFAAGAEIGFAKLVSFVPQVEYGKLNDQVLPQEAFYFGGSRSLRTVESGTIGGTGKAIARLDVIGARDIIGATRLFGFPASAMTFGAFTAIGAVWGEDPFGGPTRPGLYWPDDRRAWLSEVGLSMLLRPGLPDPAGFIHFDYGWPVGPNHRPAAFSLYYARPLFLVKPIVR
jgi:Omp85 superfamily domain